MKNKTIFFLTFFVCFSLNPTLSNAFALSQIDICEIKKNLDVNSGDSNVKYLNVKGNFKLNDDLPDNINIKVYDIKTKALIEESGINSKGNYSLSLKRGRRYFVSFEAPGHFFDASFLALPNNGPDKRFLQNYKVDKINYGSVNKKYMFTFNKGSGLLTNTSELFLNLLTNFLKKNPDVICDLSINKSENKELNIRRINTVIRYLSFKGIYKSRLTLNLIDFNIPQNNVLVTVFDKISITALNQ